MKFYLVATLVFTIFPLLADTIEMTYYLDEPQIYNDKGFNRIESDDLVIITLPGYPELPSKQVRLLLPPGESFQEIEVIPGKKIEIEGEIDLFPIQEPYPLSYEGDVSFTDQDPEIFDSESVYPQEICRNSVTHYYRGYSVFLADLTPFEYQPKLKKLYYYESLTINLITENTIEAERAFSNFLGANNTQDFVVKNVQNPEMAVSYPDNTILRDDVVDLYIITSSTYSDVFDDFVLFKKNQGYTTEIKLTDNIYTEYSGADNAEKIRNFIIDAYQNNNTEYIILGGDTEIIPHRGFYLAAGSTIDYDLPSDLYYSGLDRVGAGSGPDWNTDDDSYWGETNEADYFAEIMIGRISADTQPEFEAALNKQIMYQESPVITDLEKAIMVGENLDNDPLTWGGTYKDEIINGGTYNGYTTTGFPANFTVDTQYDRTSTWSWTELKDKFNAGVNLVNHLGHSSTSYNMKFYTSYVTDTNLTSNGTNHNFYIIYSQGCYPAAFDNRNSSGTYGSDVIVEEFTTIDNGCVAFLGNTRYGWYNPGGTNSGSQYLDRQFFDALFGEDIYQIAAMHEDSRADGASQCNGDPWFRWAYYEVTLFGDPSLDVWTSTPTAISATYNSGIELGAAQIEFFTDAPGARIGLLQDGVVIGRGVTDNSGDLQLDLFNPVASDSDIDVSIICHDRIRYTGSIVVFSNEPYVLYNSSSLDDSSGNNNGLADYGETVDLTIELRNAGNQSANNVFATLSTLDPEVTIIDNNESYGSIGAASNSSVNNGFQFTVDNDVADQTEINFELEVTADDRVTWISNFSILLHAPELQILTWQVDDSVTGNGNGRLDPDESADIILELKNTGHSSSPAVSVDLTTADSEITVNTGSINVGSLLADQTSNVSFNVTVEAGVTTGTPVQLNCSVNAGNYSIAESETFAVGLTADDFENGDLSSFDWQFSGNADWFISTNSPYEGSYCSESGDIEDDGTSSLFLEAEVLAAGDIFFYRKVSSESNYDYLRFYIDDVLQDEWSGEISWSQVSYPVSAGIHTFKWSFEKDLSISNGSDCAWIDYIIFPAIEMPGIPDIEVGEQTISIQLETDTTTVRQLRIENTGDGTLNYTVTTDYGSRNSGGPDVFGYTWKDSNEPDGPDYSWIDISESATEVTFTHNDEASSLLDIGFVFPFYTETYTQLRISPNGWIGFGDDWANYYNYSIPATDAPRPAVFGLWDDLDPLQGGNVYYSGNEERFLIWFDDVIHYPGYYNGTYDFQMILYNSGNIVFQYRTVSGDLNTCTIGIQDEMGTDGLEVAYNEAYLENQLAVEIIRPLNWLDCDPDNSSLSGGSWENVDLSISSSGLTTGTYICNLQINSNDPDEDQVIVPVSLTVTNSNISAPDNVRIIQSDNQLILTWDLVPQATNYKILASEDPVTDFILVHTTAQNNWEIPLDDRLKFFKIIASD